MSKDRTSNEDLGHTEPSEPVPEADALEQAAEISPVEDDETPSNDGEVPEADAIEQARVVPPEGEERA
jgi:hypothetical protein